MLIQIEGITLKQQAEKELKAQILQWQGAHAMPEKDYMIGIFHTLLVWAYRQRRFASPDAIPQSRAIHTLKNLARYAVLKYFKHGLESLYGGNNA